jgi:3-deoxy-D-arabino-heptulosonate 7-phosphate (DAHP) synthase|tara:strand:- start:284 stop:484 length:201 start_codon:yes stop_codon:yes gene_type:complete
MDWLTATEFLLKQSRKRQEELKNTLSVGGVRNFEQYQRIVGELSGLNFIENEIIGLHRRMETPDEE